MNKIIVIGAVETTAATINCLVENNFEIQAVFGFEPSSIENVSGYSDLRTLSNKLQIAFYPYKKINKPELIETAKALKPDIIFAVGFSQLLSDEWLKIPKMGCVGFHPTQLPRGRGRAPLAWIILRERKGAATFFLMTEGADDGPIFVQKSFEVDLSDDASSVHDKILLNLRIGLNEWLPTLKAGIWEPVPQSEINSSWYGLRKPDDALINWYDSSHNIDLLIKASTKPHPGAYFYFNYNKIIVHKSRVESEIPYFGVVGRVLIKDSNRGLLVQTGDGLLWIDDLELPESVQIKVGDRLRMNIEDELVKMKNQIESLLK